MPPSAPPSPAHIFEALQSYQRTNCLRAGIDLKVFTAIAGGARVPETLAAACHASAKGIRVLCDYLTTMGFLTKHDGAYALTADSELFLVESSPAYMGAMVNFLFHPAMQQGLMNVAGAVRKGGTVLPDRGSVSEDNPVWVDFARGMAPLMMPAARTMAELAAGSGPLKVLDIAAGHGMFGVAIAQRNPAAVIYALDWKNVLTVAHENAVKLRVAERWHAIEGNAFTTDCGSDYDTLLVTNFLHHFDVPTNVGLLKRLRAAMKDGAKLVILEHAVNDDRVTPPVASAFALTMLTTTPSGDAFSRREIATMCEESGFREVAHHTVPETLQTITVAVK